MKYEKIAKAVSDTVTEWEHSWKTDEMTPAQLAVASLAEKLAVLFAQDNERFNPSKFYTACGFN